MSRLRESLARAGVRMVRGDVYIAPNDKLRFSQPPAGGEGHRVIVYQAPEVLQDDAVKTVTVVVCTSHPALNDDVLEVPIAPEDIGPGRAFATRCYAVVTLVQPLQKSDLVKWVGTVGETTLEQMDAAIVVALGIVPACDPE